MAQKFYQTRSVLAGAYRANQVEACKTHLVEVTSETDSTELRVLCRGPKLENICDEFADDPTAEPTCPRCRARWDALKAKGELNIKQRSE